MLFGTAQPKRKGLFGLFDPGQAAIPLEQTIPQAVTPSQAAMLPEKKPGFFAEGGLGRQIAGVLGDSILQAQGQQPIYLQNLMQQKAMKQRQQMMQDQRAADWEDWQRQQQWTLDHKQSQPHYWESNDGSLMSIGADGQPQRVYSDPTPKYNWIPDGMGGGRYEAIPGTGGAPQYPSAPVGKLTPIGGVSGNTGAGFPIGNLDAITAGNESGNRDFYSNGAPVVSSKGARFAMQVLPSTARDPGFGLKPANPNDPADMNRLGREYRAMLQKRYGNNLPLMWAAYNAGPGRIDQLLKQYGQDWLKYAPQETQVYVSRNMRSVKGN